MTLCILTVWNFGGSIKKLFKNHQIVLLILVALIIRLVAVDHGFPLIYHPDEPTVVRSALGIRFDLNPHHFDWPHLYFYLNYFVYMVFAKIRDIVTSLGFRSLVAQISHIIYNDRLVFYLISRIFSAALGALTVVPIYLWVKKLANKNAGLLSSALLTLAPLHVRNSHYALIDVPMLFFLSWSLFFATCSPILSGLFLGLSASTKYNGVLGAVFIAAYYLITKKKLADFIKTGVFTIVGFLIGTPFSIIDYKTFITTDGPQGALWQFTNTGKVTFFQNIQQFVTALTIKLPDDLGYGALLMFTTGLIVLGTGLVKKERVDKIILLAATIFLALVFFISGQKRNPSHYYLVIYPYFFLVAGWTLDKVANEFKKLTYKAALIVLILLPSAVLSIQSIIGLVNRTSDRIYGGDTMRMLPERNPNEPF